MKLIAIAIAAAGLAACATAPRADPPEMSPGVYLLVRGSQSELMDLDTMTSALLRAGDFCARTNQKPEIIYGGEGDEKFMAFQCGEEGVWPPPR